MKSHWRKLASLLPSGLEKKVYQSHFEFMHNQWEKGENKLPPSHLIKQKLIKQIAQSNCLSILVETGTYLGDMVYAMQNVFDQIYSIELSHHFYVKATKRFQNFKNVKILEGDSGKVLNRLVPQLEAPALFWLDGHYSGGKTAKGEKDCPIYEELSSIFSSGFQHTILIDDARLFIGENDYPTPEDLNNFVLMHKPTAEVNTKNDVIIITYK